MVKRSSTNSSFFKTGGRMAASHETVAQSQKERKPVENLSHGAGMQGKEGQPNYIPGKAPVGETSASRPVRKK